VLTDKALFVLEDLLDDSFVCLVQRSSVPVLLEKLRLRGDVGSHHFLGWVIGVFRGLFRHSCLLNFAQLLSLLSVDTGLLLRCRFGLRWCESGLLCRLLTVRNGVHRLVLCRGCKHIAGLNTTDFRRHSWPGLRVACCLLAFNARLRVGCR
jgi:hypothetical protein